MKKEYTSPSFSFSELKLAERIADKCWGEGKAWWNNPPETHGPEDIELPYLGGCKGHSTAEALEKWIEDNIGIQEDIRSSVANTKASEYFYFS